MKLWGGLTISVLARFGCDAIAWIGESVRTSEIRLEDAEGQARISWQPDAPVPSSRRGTRASFRTGAGGMQIVFAYTSDVALSVQAEVLLQVLADQVHGRLVALKSALIAHVGAAEQEENVPASTNSPSLSTS